MQGEYTVSYLQYEEKLYGKNDRISRQLYHCGKAERWAKRYDKGILNIYTVRMDSGLTILEFKEMTEEWLDFIIDCRRGKAHNYDIVIGAMANDQIYNYIADYIDGVITREQFWVLAKFKYPTHQVNFCSPNALKCLEFISSEEVSQ